MFVMDAQPGIAVEMARIEDASRRVAGEGTNFALGCEKVISKGLLAAPYSNDLEAMSLRKEEVGGPLHHAFDCPSSTLRRERRLKGRPNEWPHALLASWGGTEIA